MTRQEEIRNAVDTTVPILPSNNERTYEQALIASGFEEGVKWADKSPKSPWISIKDDLPCNHKELISSDKSSENLTVTEYVVAAIYGYKVLSRMYELDGKWYWENDEPTHWFPIPEPPK